jgi:hypothetical protein
MLAIPRASRLWCGNPRNRRDAAFLVEIQVCRMDGKSMLPRLSFVLVAGALVTFTAVSYGQNVHQPPTPQHRTYAAQIGWQPSANLIGKALAGAYAPAREKSAGSAGDTSFQSWLLLYRWCELLSRNEKDELARYLGRFLITDQAGRLTLLPSGYPMPDGAHILSRTEVEKHLANPESRTALLKGHVPADYSPGTGLVADSLNPKFLAAMAQDEAFLRTFFANLSDDDFAPEVLHILQAIWQAAPDRWADYRNLAIAIAIVRDQPGPSWWPHTQVPQANVPLASNLGPVDEFQFWVSSNEQQKLYTDLRKLDPEELKFVVDAPVAQSELVWAQKFTHFPRADYGRAFSSIRYREDRLNSGTLVWNEGPYTLAAIQQKGGICVDQAYFAMLSGKAHGLPTLYFSGQGTDGGHAWLGYLQGEHRWDMNCGRYLNQNFATGEALDPQNWLPITDHELASLAASFRRMPEYVCSEADLAMAELFREAGDPKNELAAIDSAIADSPSNDTAWASKGEYLDRVAAPIATKQAFHTAAIKQFSKNPDLQASHQKALAELARAAGDTAGAQSLESSIINQTRRNRSDLAVDTGAGQLSQMVQAGKFDDAMRTYRSLLGGIGRTSGGSFFYQIVQPFTEALVQAGNIPAAKRAVELARTAMRPAPDSIIFQDFNALEKSLSSPQAGAVGK